MQVIRNHLFTEFYTSRGDRRQIYGTNTLRDDDSLLTVRGLKQKWGRPRR